MDDDDCLEDCSCCCNCPTKLSQVSWILAFSLCVIASFLCIIFFKISNEKPNIQEGITIAIVSIYSISGLLLLIVLYDRCFRKKENNLSKNIDKRLEVIIK
jgi:nitrogen fixation/metabolism regulation signal transduction histidine kinase